MGGTIDDQPIKCSDLASLIRNSSRQMRRELKKQGCKDLFWSVRVYYGEAVSFPLMT